MKPSKISRFVMMGDSLSDRGTLARRYLCWVFSMSYLSGLSQHSPLGRFTNGLAWTDHVSAMVADQFIIGEAERNPDNLKPEDSTDLSDDVLDGEMHTRAKPHQPTPQASADLADDVLGRDPRIAKLVENSYFLDNDRTVRYKGQDFVRNYDEGGLTAYDYSWLPSYSIVRYFTRLILSTLNYMRERLLGDDKAHEVSVQHKAETLVVEWSGANDLMTVNARPSKAEVDSAVKARIQNAETLIQNGYRHFVLFNLPDLSLTPRYQAKSAEEQNNARECSVYFNEQLALAAKKLAETYPHASVEIFDVGGLFTEVYENPEEFGFEKDKLKTPYTESRDFSIHKDRTSSAPGYMFWDDVHPTARLHALLAERFYNRFKLEYNFSPPDLDVAEQKPVIVSEAELLASFRTTYEKQFLSEQLGLFGGWRKSNLSYATADLKQILQHALYGEGHRTREIIEKLQWIDHQGNLKLNIPCLHEAMDQLMQEQGVLSVLQS